jgi:hypothetical protein
MRRRMNLNSRNNWSHEGNYNLIRVFKNIFARVNNLIYLCFQNKTPNRHEYKVDADNR